jgi:hypothetical protein
VKEHISLSLCKEKCVVLADKHVRAREYLSELVLQHEVSAALLTAVRILGDGVSCTESYPSPTVRSINFSETI